ncbi:Uncharacterised protein [Burkholderia gladioli]|nr:Uncharacterised protein [Burkholderia gladioli]
MSGEFSTFTPPASASSHSSRCTLWQAACTATSPDEQAVLIARFGPFRSSTYEIRAARMPLWWLVARPSAASPGTPSSTPTNTPQRLPRSRSPA